MKILWLVNNEFPEVSKYYSRKPNTGSGSWMLTLLSNLKSEEGLEIHVGYGTYTTTTKSFESDGVKYHLMGFNSWDAKINNNSLNLSLISKLVNDVKPDIIHVFGTEKFYGLINLLVDVPVIIRIQGVKSMYLKYFFIDTPIKLVLNLKLLKTIISWSRWKKTESKIFKSNIFFEGQTDWDLSGIKAMTNNSKFKYFKNYPILRNPFYLENWKFEEIEKFSITAIGSIFPYKGIHTLLKSIAVIKYKYPQVTLNLLGNVKNKGYGLYIKELSKNLGIQNNIKYCGFLDEYQMSKLFSKSHIFINPSFIENESLAMLEALSVGTPTIVTYTGGMPDNTSSNWIEYFPVGESAVLANKIEKLFKKSDFEIKKISKDAMNAIRKKLDKELIVSKTIQMYKEVLDSFKK